MEFSFKVGKTVTELITKIVFSITNFLRVFDDCFLEPFMLIRHEMLELFDVVDFNYLIFETVNRENRLRNEILF